MCRNVSSRSYTLKLKYINSTSDFLKMAFESIHIYSVHFQTFATKSKEFWCTDKGLTKNQWMGSVTTQDGHPYLPTVVNICSRNTGSPVAHCSQVLVSQSYERFKNSDGF